MAQADPIGDWDFLCVSNVVPLALEMDHQPWPCALCHVSTHIDSRGSLYTGPVNCAAVCDACGTRQAPGLMALVHRLRACTDLTVTVGGARIDEDDHAWTCPLCAHEHGDRRSGWHLVDVACGRPVCISCVATLPADLQDLAAALDAHERQTDRWTAEVGLLPT